MRHELITPNYHVLLVHYPLALLFAGTVIELFSFLWRRSGFRAAGRWMILIGALSAAPTATAGLYAMWDVSKPHGVSENTMSWAEIRQNSPVQGRAWEMLQRHAWLNAFASAAFLLIVVIWLGSSDPWREKLHWPLLILLLLGLGVVTLGAWYGGEMVYQHGVGVERVAGVQPEVSPTTTTTRRGDEAAEVWDAIRYVIPPLQAHVILAGATIAMAMAALGMSIRAGGTYAIVESSPQTADMHEAFIPRPATPIESMRREEIVRPRTPAARFWLIAALIGVVTAITGVVVLAQFADVHEFDLLWGQVKDTSVNFGTSAEIPAITRRLVHVVAGSSIIVLLLILALLARVAAARRIVLGFFVLLLLCTVAAQIWLGSLLMLDMPGGPLTRFNQ